MGKYPTTMVLKKTDVEKDNDKNQKSGGSSATFAKNRERQSQFRPGMKKRNSG